MVSGGWLFSNVLLTWIYKLMEAQWQGFYPHSQCDQNIKKEFQFHEMVTKMIWAMRISRQHIQTSAWMKSFSLWSYTVFWDLNSDFNWNWMGQKYILFLVSGNEYVSYSWVQDDTCLTWETHQVDCWTWHQHQLQTTSSWVQPDL